MEHWLCPGCNSMCQEGYHIALPFLSILLGLAKAAHIWGTESLNSQESKTEPAERFSWTRSDPHIFVLCTRAQGPCLPLLCPHSSESSWKNKNLNNGKIKKTNEFPNIDCNNNNKNKLKKKKISLANFK